MSKIAVTMRSDQDLRSAAAVEGSVTTPGGLGRLFGGVTGTESANGANAVYPVANYLNATALTPCRL